MIYGYCRISTKKQSIDRQIRNINSLFPDAHIVTEAYTGTKIDRPEWKKIYKNLKPDDTVVFDEVSRMSRNAEEGMTLYEELFNKGVHLIFIKEPHINTDVYSSKLAQQIEKVATGNKATDKLLDSIIEALHDYMIDLAKEQIRLAFVQAQKEVDYLHKRTKEGLETAKLNGKKLGLPEGTKLTTKKSLAAKEIILKHNKSFGGSLNDEETIKQCGISRKTFYKYKTELKCTV